MHAVEGMRERPFSQATALIHRILVATDFSEGSSRALECAADLARRCEAPLLMVHVSVPAMAPAIGAWPIDRGDRARRSTVETELARIAGKLRDDGLAEVDAVEVAGDPAHQIVALARERRCDLIVIGAQGQSCRSDTCVGNVTDRVVHGASCSVLVAAGVAA